MVLDGERKPENPEGTHVDTQGTRKNAVRQLCHRVTRYTYQTCHVGVSILSCLLFCVASWKLHGNFDSVDSEGCSFSHDYIWKHLKIDIPTIPNCRNEPDYFLNLGLSINLFFHGQMILRWLKVRHLHSTYPKQDPLHHHRNGGYDISSLVIWGTRGWGS